ncbi:hypothetical protein [Nostoc sp.]|uniref:hypothetical protein n=1 Tax=Nostoc sp. TaxID=1180 RepID=UPI002FFAAA5F
MADITKFEREDAEVLLNQLQQFQKTLQQEWSRVSNQWGNLKSVWLDEQFENFEPLFEKLSATYDDANRECEGYIAFLNRQIQIDEEREQRLRNRLST